MEKQKIEVIITKHCRARRGISLFNKKKDENNKNHMDLNQTNDKYPLQFLEGMW